MEILDLAAVISATRIQNMPPKTSSVEKDGLQITHVTVVSKLYSILPGQV